MAGESTESAVNQELGDLLWARYPEWGNGISVERTGMFEETTQIFS